MSPEPRSDESLTGSVLAAFYRVYNKLGYGHFESVYANALAIELTRARIDFAREAPIDVTYDGIVVGHFRADLLVADRLLLELKATPKLAAGDRAQLLSYLRGSGLSLGLLLHFGPDPDARRVEL